MTFTRVLVLAFGCAGTSSVQDDSSIADIWGCAIESEAEVSPTVSVGSAPSANDMMSGLDGSVRDVVYQGSTPPADIPWTDVLQFDIQLAGAVHTATLIIPETDSPELFTDCVTGDFLIAEVDVGIAGEHFDTLRPGTLRWSGPDPYTDAWLVLDGGEVRADEWLTSVAQEVIDDTNGCGGFEWVGIGSFDTSAGGVWASLELNLSVAGESCMSTLAEATWIDEGETQE
jgi:hypothetical protein